MLSVAAVLIIGAAALPARAESPFQSDVDRCAVRAWNAGHNQDQGKIRLQLMVGTDGKVYSAFVHDEESLDDRVLEICLAERAVEWQFGPLAIDSTRGFRVTFVPPANDGSPGSDRYSTFLPAIRETDLGTAPLNEAAAKASINFADGATPAQRGEAYRAAHLYAEAAKALDQALKNDPTDPLALRSKAELLAETHRTDADLQPAVELVKELAQRKPGSVEFYEAQLAVCSAAEQDDCTAKYFQLVRAAPNANLRANVINGFVPAVKRAEARLAAVKAGGPASAGEGAPKTASAASPASRCAQAGNLDSQVRCTLDTCFGEGMKRYSAKLAAQNGAEYELGAWSLKPAGSKRILATRSLTAKGPAAQSEQAIWLVKTDAGVALVPENNPARQISLEYNACYVRRVPAPGGAAASSTAPAGSEGKH